MNLRRNLLWVDGGAGAAVGIAMLLVSGWLSELYRLPHDFVIFVGAVNLAYGCYSLNLARLSRRPAGLIWFLIAANAFWGVLCFRWVSIHYGSASIFGLGQLVAEGVFVIGLAILEWRWRHDLISA